MGRGIQARHERCRAWWEPHIRCTREFIERSVPPSSSVAVLGAGRLLDLDLDLLSEQCTEVHLFDADPTCVAEWKRHAGRRYNKSVIPHTVDLTDTLEAWSREIRVVSHADYERALGQLVAPLPTWAETNFDGVLSLNLLGQIPLYWRDRVLAMKPELTDAEWGALVASMGRLQRRHIEAVRSASRAWSILISDTEYYFYHVDESLWRVEPAIFDATLTDGNFGLENSSSVTKDSWLWHIVPQFVESDHEGEIHRVEARVMQW